jgi:micrococcal nuclease
MLLRALLAGFLAALGMVILQVADRIAPTPLVKDSIKIITEEAQPATNPQETTATITKVIDGDTIELSTGERVRYIGIDTPELFPKNGSGKQCFSGEAAARNTELVFQKEVTLVPDKENTDKYGRLLRYVYVGDTFVNKILVKEGYAYAKEYRPNTSKHIELDAAMQYARSEKRGMWGECNN